MERKKSKNCYLKKQRYQEKNYCIQGGVGSWPLYPGKSKAVPSSLSLSFSSPFSLFLYLFASSLVYSIYYIRPELNQDPPTKANIWSLATKNSSEPTDELICFPTSRLTVPSFLTQSSRLSFPFTVLLPLTRNEYVLRSSYSWTLATC